MKHEIYILALLALVSCSTQKEVHISKIKKGTVLTKVYLGKGDPLNKSKPRPIFIEKYVTTKNEFATIKNNGSTLDIEFLDKKRKCDKQESITVKHSLDNVNSKLNIPYRFAHNGLLWDLKKDRNLPNSISLVESDTFKDAKYTLFLGNKFTYFQSSSSLQTLTIPFKYRPSLNDTSTYSLSTGINIGFAYTFKTKKTSYRPIYEVENSNLLGYTDHQLQFAFAPFIGMTSIDLKKTNTENKINEDRKVFGMSFGATATIKVNTVDIGIALGIDHGFGKDAKNWIYQDKGWIGIVVGLDIIK